MIYTVVFGWLRKKGFSKFFRFRLENFRKAFNRSERKCFAFEKADILSQHYDFFFILIKISKKKKKLEGSTSSW